MITLLQLDYFRRLAATEHITQTARELFISQTALSSMIIGLEKELGVQLFDRSRRAIHLNEAGRVYLEYVNQVFLALENGRSALSDIAGARESQVSLAVGTSLVWMPMIRSFHQACPHLALRQTNMSTEGLSRALTNLSVDFVIAGEEDIQSEELEKQWLKEDLVYLCVPQNHPLAGCSSVSMQDIRNEAFINMTPGFPWRMFCDKLFEKAGYAPHVAVECDYTLRGSLIESGFGVALTSSSAKQVDLLKPNRYVLISDSFARRNMYLFWNPRRYVSKACLDFKDFCRGFYAQAEQ